MSTEFANSVFNALSVGDRYSLQTAIAARNGQPPPAFDKNTRCLHPKAPDSSGGSVCPAPSVSVAVANDNMRHFEDQGDPDAAKAMTLGAGANLYYLAGQYGILANNVEWEDIQRHLGLAREDLQSLGYARKSRFLDGNPTVAQVTAALPPAAIEAVPIWFDRFAPPAVVALLAVVVLAVVLVLLAAAYVRWSRHRARIAFVSAVPSPNPPAPQAA